MIREASALIGELLNLSIHLRETYKAAYRQSGAIGYLRLRELFDSHYLEQLRILDLLSDDFARGWDPRLALISLTNIHPSQNQKRKVAGAAWLPILLQSHECVLTAAQAIAAKGEFKTMSQAVVKQLIKTNELQAWVIDDEIVLQARGRPVRGRPGGGEPIEFRPKQRFLSAPIRHGDSGADLAARSPVATGTSRVSTATLAEK